MKKFLTAALFVCGMGLGQSRLHAQAPFGPPAPPGPNISRPTFSPYINLLRGGSPTYLNYYGLVRPQNSFQNQINGLQASQSAGPYFDSDTGLPLTGHPTQFFNTSHYFFNRNGAGGMAGATGGSATGASRLGKSGSAGSLPTAGFSSSSAQPANTPK